MAAVDGLDWTDVDELPRVVAVESRCGVRACRASLRADEPAIQFLLRRAAHGVAGTSQTLADPQEPDESPLEPPSIAAVPKHPSDGGARRRVLPASVPRGGASEPSSASPERVIDAVVRDRSLPCWRAAALTRRQDCCPWSSVQRKAMLMRQIATVYPFAQ